MSCYHTSDRTIVVLIVCLFTGLSCHHREPGLAGQKQVSVFSYVETAGGVGEANLPMGESSAPNMITQCTGILLPSSRVYIDQRNTNT